MASSIQSFLEADELRLLLALQNQRYQQHDINARNINDEDCNVRKEEDASADDGLPRVPFQNSFGPLATPEGKAAFVSALEKHGYVILTNVSEGELLYRQLETRMTHDLFMLKNAQLEEKGAGEDGEQGVLVEPCGSSRKEAFQGSVYFNERGVPMWRCGYEFVEDKVREAFRVHAGAGEDLVWPSERMHSCWRSLTHFCVDLTDRALLTVLSSSKEDNKEVSMTLEDLAKARRLGEDLSVAYALHYPNEEGGAPTLPLDVTGGQLGINVKAHVDPSLLVVEPVADVPGLDVFDPTLDAQDTEDGQQELESGGGAQRNKKKGRWVSVERACASAPASSWVVFGGRCLETATKGRVKACLHRVTAPNHRELTSQQETITSQLSKRTPFDTQREAESATTSRRRFCFIFEQKLADFYDSV